VADEDNGSSRGRQVAHAAQAFLLKIAVADGQHLVDEQ
jgi:hypothetical protein